MNKYAEWLNMLEEENNDVRNPDVLRFFISNMKEIVHDVKSYTPSKKYKYMLTFTIDPKKHEVTSDLKDKIEIYICNLMRKPETTKCYYVREHDKTNCHWHVILYRKSAIKSDYLSYYKKTFGHVDISRSKDLSDTHSEKYLSKESEIIQIV